MPSKNETILGALGRRHVHPFPARMAPELVCHLIADSKRPIRVLDPMMGSGTVLALAQSKHHHAIGVDIDPLAVLISGVWTTPVSIPKVEAEATKVLARSKRLVKSLSLGDAYPYRASKATRVFVRYWFDGYTRKQLTALSRSIAKVGDASIRNVLWCAFSRLIISKQSGASLALDLAHSRPHRHFTTAPSKPFPKFLSSVDFVLKNSLAKYARTNGPAVKLREGDARKLPIRTGSIDLVVTSPPYLNAIDYIRCSKFSLVWMGYDIAGLSKLRSKSVGTEKGRRLDNDPQIEKILKSLRIEGLSRRRHAVVSAYVDDMRLAIEEVERVLVPGGEAVYVIGENTMEGIYIKNAAILTSLAKNAGLKLREETSRPLPPNKRYLPPPTKNGQQLLDTRMRAEVILRFGKPKT
jgi:DNA modification methylase